MAALDFRPDPGLVITDEIRRMLAALRDELECKRRERWFCTIIPRIRPSGTEYAVSVIREDDAGNHLEIFPGSGPTDRIAGAFGRWLCKQDLLDLADYPDAFLIQRPEDGYVHIVVPVRHETKLPALKSLKGRDVVCDEAPRLGADRLRWYLFAESVEIRDKRGGGGEAVIRCAVAKRNPEIIKDK